MARPSRAFRLLRVGFAMLFAAAGTNHALLASRGQGDVTRHALFVGINIGAAALVVFRPRWAFGPLAVLATQQAYSHGSDLALSIRSGGAFDWTSLGVLVFFAALLATLGLERRAARPNPRQDRSA